MPENQSFADILRALNVEQRAAVTHIDGPVLVVAGPGTGKTHILSARIGQILTETDTSPYNILCLTFTDAGVQAMRERLLKIIGAAAHKVHIFTFHAFCNKVIQDNLDLFGRQELGLIDELERQEIIRHILDALDFNHPLKSGRNDPYFYERHLADLFKLMKTEAWTPQFVADSVNQYVESLSSRPEYIYQISKKNAFQKGDLKVELIEEERQKMQRLLAAAQLFPQFERILRGRRRYDFDDMILWVIEAFEKMPFLLRNYQEQYLYFLVDEYQDTNGSQNKILQQLIGFWENPNVFIVGDDDQAIYEFQGARLKNLVDFYEKYQRDLKIVLLKENYRSSQPILDASRSLIDNNALRLVTQLKNLKLDKNLVAASAFANAQNPPKVMAFANRFQEMAYVVAEIEAMHAAGRPLSSVAVIYAKHREVEGIIDLLNKKRIPYQTKRRLNVLDAPLIQNLRLLLEYLNLESQKAYAGDYLLFKILNINFLEFSANDILTIAAHVASLQHRGENAAEAPAATQKTVFWRAALTETKVPHLEAPERLRRVLKLMNTWTQALHNEPLISVFESIINQSGLLSWAQNSPTRLLSVQIINTFFAFVRSEVEKSPRLGLDELLTRLSVLDSNGIAIELVQNIVHTEGVVLTTAHSAKGLEFERVFLIDAVESEWEKARSRAAGRFKLPDTLTYSAEEDGLEARRRLFYVAITRAKSQLTISYAQADDRGRPLSKSQFLDEMAAFTAHETVQADAETLLDTQLTALSETVILDREIVENPYVDTVLKQFTLSISALNAYLDCPLGFYFDYILQVPSTPSPFFGYGTAVHYALRKLFGEMLRAKDKTFPAESEFLRYFELEMERQRAFFTQKEFERRLAMGKTHLSSYYQRHVEHFEKNVVVEKSVVAESDGVPLRGVLDKIEFSTDGTVNIVDYKTGRYDVKYTAKPTEKNPNGGKYWRQLAFYKVLYENYRAQTVRVRTGEIAYLEPDAKGHFHAPKLVLDGQDATLLRGLLVATWGNIQQKKFDGCGKSTCHWCQFVKNNRLVDSFRNTETESLDD